MPFGWLHIFRIAYRWYAFEDREISAVERTKRILWGSMGGVEDFLTFTVETEEDFEDGWLPTLDMAVRVSPANQLLFKFWEKPTNTNRTIHKRSSMGENMKQQILTQEIIRRLGNTCEGLSKEVYEGILNEVSQKMINSGYEVDQVRKIVVAGIKGWGNKILRCRADGKRLRRSARCSLEQRTKRKLLGRANWFKSKGSSQKENLYGSRRGPKGSNQKKMGAPEVQSPAPRSVLFVEQTPGGELAQRLRELFVRLEPTVGFYIKVVEKTGKKLTSLFPLTTLWSGASCGREGECITCYQDAEVLPDCTQQSILYENVCAKCIPEARAKKPIGSKDLEGRGAALYVGETSRSIRERGGEHWASYKGGKEENHMVKHQWLKHGGEQADFILRVVGSKKTALCRQISEAVRIRRRGGEEEILNSRAEYNRSHIPRLQVEEEAKIKKREEELRKEEVIRNKQLEDEQHHWELEHTRNRDRERQNIVEHMRKEGDNLQGSKKRVTENPQEPKKGRKNKRRRKHAPIREEWGEAHSTAREETGPEKGADHLVIGSSGIVEEEEGRELILPPSSPGKGEEVGKVLTLKKLPQCGRVGALTQRSMSEFLTPTREGLKPRAAILADIPPTEDVVTTGAFEGEPDIEGGGDLGGGIQTVNTGKDRGVLTPMTDGQVSGTEVFLENEVTPSVVEEGEIAPEESHWTDEAANRDTVGTDDYDTRWQGILLNSIDKSEECVILGQDCASITVSNDTERTTGHDCAADTVSNEECEFTRRGMCKTHGIKGKRTELKSKVWKKRKYDYGYVTTKKIVFTCNVGKQTDVPSNKLEVEIDASQTTSQSKGVFDLGSDNLQRDNLGGITRQEGLCLKEKV